MSLGRCLQQGWSCGWSPAPDLCRNSKCQKEYLLSLWAGCWAWLVAMLWLCCCHLHIQAWWFNQVERSNGNSALTSVSDCAEADSVNTFLDGRAEEPNMFLFWKSHYPISVAVSCCSHTISVFESCLRAGKSVLCSVRWLLPSPAWIPIWLQQNRK